MTPHRVFAITCPAWNGNDSFSKAYSFAGKKKIIGGGLVDPTHHPDDYRRIYLSAESPCRDGHALRNRLDARYPERDTPDGWYVYPFKTCWAWVVTDHLKTVLPHFG